MSSPPGASRAAGGRALGARLAPRRPGRPDAGSGPTGPLPGQTKEGPRGLPRWFKDDSAAVSSL